MSDLLAQLSAIQESNLDAHEKITRAIASMAEVIDLLAKETDGLRADVDALASALDRLLTVVGKAVA